MMHRLVIMLCACSVALSAQRNAQTKAKKPQPVTKSLNELALEYCREFALTHLKYAKTLEWTDHAREETPGLFLVAGVRDAKAPDGEAVQQNYTCRFERVRDHWELRLFQAFKESTKTGRDVFIIRKKQ
jgi:hypothetical protein